MEVVADATSPVPASPVPVHPAAAALLLVVDNLWGLADFAIVDWILTIPACFITVFVPTFLIQRRLRKDSVGMALVKALFLGIVAAVPFSVTGTPVGLAILAWAGIKKGSLPFWR
ncbi:MAG TPA: hypothetical protein VMF06_23835 [Candidatus Limnocylindria bacterium]|nr:hypothetical protein [Candidatus Limnocylindria bacterium]